MIKSEDKVDKRLIALYKVRKAEQHGIPNIGLKITDKKDYLDLTSLLKKNTSDYNNALNSNRDSSRQFIKKNEVMPDKNDLVANGSAYAGFDIDIADLDIGS